MKSGSTIARLIAGILVLQGSLSAEEKKPPKVTYADHVLPILRARCFSCHNTDKSRGGLDLSNYTALMEGGSSGKVVSPGDSSQSYLYALITHAKKPSMPPRSPKIPNEELETIRKWIDGGVLETDKSKAVLPKRENLDLALKTIPSQRPKEPPMPGKLNLQPFTRAEKTTAVSALATSPWAPVVAVAGQKQVLLYNSKTLELLGALPFPEGRPEVIRFSRNGSLLIVGGGRGGASGKVALFEVKTGKRILTVGDELDTVLAADISSDHRLIALGGPQRTVRIYTTKDGRMIHELKKHTEWIYSVEFSPDGVLLATADRNGGMFVWEAFTGREYLTLKGHTSAITRVSWRADSNILASCSEDSTIRLWEMENGGQIKSWGAHGGGASNVEFARDGRLLSTGRDKVTKLWDQNGKQLKAFSAFTDIGLQATFCDETNRAIAGDWNGEIRVWDAVKGDVVGKLTSNPPTLTERLTLSQKEVATAEAKQKNLAAAYQAAQAAATKAQTDLQAAQQAFANAKKVVDQGNVTVANLKKAIPQITAEQVAATKVVTDLQGVLPLIQEALAKSQAALAKAAGDKELTEVVTKLTALVKSRADQLTAAQKVATEKAAALKKAQTDLDTVEKQIKDTATVMATSQKQIQALTPTVKPLSDKALTAKTALDAAAAELAAAQKEVQKWQSEIALSKAQASSAAGKK